MPFFLFCRHFDLTLASLASGSYPANQEAVQLLTSKRLCKGPLLKFETSPCGDCLGRSHSPVTKVAVASSEFVQLVAVVIPYAT